MKGLIEAKKISGPPLLDDEETKILPTSSSRFGYANPKNHGFSQETLKIQVEPSIHKSRRIEIPREMSSILS